MDERRLYAKALAAGRLTPTQAVCGLMRYYIMKGYTTVTLSRDLCLLHNPAIADAAIERLWKAVEELERMEDDRK